MQYLCSYFLLLNYLASIFTKLYTECRAFSDLRVLYEYLAAMVGLYDTLDQR